MIETILVLAILWLIASLCYCAYRLGHIDGRREGRRQYRDLVERHMPSRGPALSRLLAELLAEREEGKHGIGDGG